MHGGNMYSGQNIEYNTLDLHKISLFTNSQVSNMHYFITVLYSLLGGRGKNL